MATFTERAMDAIYAVLNDGTTGINAQTLATMRTDLGITTAELPDVAQIEQWYHRAGQATLFPYMSITIDSTTGEMEANSRFYRVSFDLALVVLDANVAGNEVQAMVAAWRYGDAIKTIFNRRASPAGGQGWTLGNASGIVRATVTSQLPGADTDVAAPNVALLTSVEVITSELY